MLKTKEEIQSWLEEMKIENYTINDDLTVDVNGDVFLGRKKLNSIPIQFGTINGSMSIWDNHLVSLKGCPSKITESFDCSHNKLKSFEYCPIEIGAYFVFYANQISTFDFFPNSVGSLVIYENDIKNIHDLKTQIKDSLSHQCSLIENCLEQFKNLYNHTPKNHYKYQLYFSAKELNAILLNKELNLELTQNNPSEKKMKI
jgi:hypothetical protein